MLPFGDEEIADNEALRAMSAMEHARMHHVGSTSWEVWRQGDDGDNGGGMEGPPSEPELKATVSGYVVQETYPSPGSAAIGVPIVGGPWVFMGAPGLDIKPGDDLRDAAEPHAQYRVDSVSSTNFTRAVLDTPT